MKKFFSLLFTLILCAFVFTVPINASEKKEENIEVIEISPRYTKQISRTSSFYFRNSKYTLTTNWTLSIDNNTGRLIAANLNSASPNLPTTYYQSTSISGTKRLNDTQIRYTLKVSIMQLGMVKETDYVEITITSLGPI